MGVFYLFQIVIYRGERFTNLYEPLIINSGEVIARPEQGKRLHANLVVWDSALKPRSEFREIDGKGLLHMFRFKHTQIIRGFTLIELMIVIAIIAILVALAVPAYNDYTIRSKIAECINGAAVAKIGISEYRQSLGAWPPSMEGAGLEAAGISHYCTALNNYQSATGEFTIDIDEAAIDSGLGLNSILPIMTPTQLSSGMINWNCSRGTTSVISLKYLPSTCRDT